MQSWRILGLMLLTWWPDGYLRDPTVSHESGKTIPKRNREKNNPPKKLRPIYHIIGTPNCLIFSFCLCCWCCWSERAHISSIQSDCFTVSGAARGVTMDGSQSPLKNDPTNGSNYRYSEILDFCWTEHGRHLNFLLVESHVCCYDWRPQANLSIYFICGTNSLARTLPA